MFFYVMEEQIGDLNDMYLNKMQDNLRFSASFIQADTKRTRLNSSGLHS